MKISVIIPSHNRPALLQEAIESVCQQSYPDWEVIVVDDGSQPPMDADRLTFRFGGRVRVLRNERPRRQPVARDQGVQAASGEVVTHLDDDDLLAPNALERALTELRAEPSLELVFLGVKGFGERATDFDEVQTGDALLRVIETVDSTEVGATVLHFGPGLLGALLRSVPMAFQRSLQYKHVWNEVSTLRRRVYRLDATVSSDEQAMACLRPPLRESEWAMYAAAICRTALINEPLYLQRCDRQGYYSVSEKQGDSAQSRLDIAEHLLLAAHNIDELRGWLPEIKDACERAWFDRAYQEFCHGRRADAWKSLAQAARTRPRGRHLRLLLRTLMPVRIQETA